MSASTPPPPPSAPPVAPPAAGPVQTGSRKSKSFPAQVFDFLSGFGFAVILLSFLFLLTFLGTLAQRNQSLFEVQREYFESDIILWDDLGFPIPLPGVRLLLALLAVNLVLGGIIRIRKRAATFGVIVTHIGMVMLLAAGLVEYVASTKGHMTLYEGDSSAQYQSYFEWEVTVTKVGETRRLSIPGEQFIELDPEGIAVFQHATLPFDLVFGNVGKNTDVLPANQHVAGSDLAVMDGFFLRKLEPNIQAEQDVAGLYFTATAGSGAGAEILDQGLLWGRQRAPHRLEHDGAVWLIDLHRKRFPVPFEIELLDFRKEEHPGTMMAKAFESDVRKTDGGQTQELTISMNEPLRHAGFTFFQASWGPSDAKPGTPLFSTFAVVRNPADSWPLWACYVITFGLLWHFCMKLWKHIQREQGKRERNLGEEA